ncbi:MAG: hypothetical protein SO355_08015 [Candidatus Faecousia sp.]|nr:hypothetical protein [Candidatus Faecousia sp.]
MINGEDKVKEYFNNRELASGNSTGNSTVGIPGEDKILKYFAKNGRFYEPGSIMSADERFRMDRTERILAEHRGRQPQADVESSDDKKQVFGKNPASDSDTSKMAPKKSEQLRAGKEAIDQEVSSFQQELRNLQQKQVGYNRSFTIGKEEKERLKAQIEEVQASLKDAESRQGELDLSINLAEREEKITAYDQYRQEADFSTVSDRARNAGYDRKTDPLGYYLANQENEDIQRAIGGLPDNTWSRLNDDEKQMYYYLLGSKGTDAAKQYLDDIQIVLDKRVYDTAQERTTEIYQNAPTAGKVGLNAMTIPSSVFGGITASSGDLIGILSGKGYNPYNQGHSLADFSSTVRGATSKDIIDSIGEDNPFWGNIASNTYQAVMSGADSALGATLFGNGYTTIMGSGAASQRARELWESGASDVQIGLGAIAAGAIEMATEKYSVEYFTQNFLEGDIAGFKDWLTKTLIQGFNEGSEEVASEIANMAANAMILGANSDNQQEIRELMDKEGMSYAEAEKQAYMNRVMDILWSGYGGFVSGGAMGGIGGTVNALQQKTATGNVAAQEQIEKNEAETGADSDADTGMEEKVADSEMEMTTEGAKTGFTVGTDSKHGTTVISFEDVPSKEVQEALKENGFKWGKKSGVWYGNATIDQAKEIVRASMAPEVEKEISSPSDGKSVDYVQTAEEEHPVSTALSFGRNSGKEITASAEADRPFEISKTVGKTFLNREDGSTVETKITGIASSEKGNLMLNVAGQDSPVSAADIIYPDSGEESLYYFLNQMQLKPAAANMVVKKADAAVAGMEGAVREEKVAEFANGIFGMYSLGENGVPLEKALNSKYGKTLTEEMKLFGHALGKSVYDAKKAEIKENAGGKETPQATAKNASVNGEEINEIQILRNAVDNISSLNLNEKEKNSLGVFAEKLKKLDSVQQQAETIRGKEAALTDYEQDKLQRLEKQADNIKKKLWDFAQYPLLKSVSAKTRELMQQEYGAIEAGENPTRAAELPAKTDSSNRVSKTARTAVEAAVTTDEAATRIREKTVEGGFSYLPITDKDAQRRAEDTILRKGWNDALSDWRVGMSKTGFPGKDMVTLGFQLYNNAVNAGDNKAAVQILTDITNTVRNSAQTVQAVRILKKLSPENRLYAIQRQLGSLQDELNRKYGDRAPQIDMNSTLAENYRNAKGEENIRAAEEALFRDIAAQLPNTFSDKWNSWRYLSMLGNVRTHVRNVLGNVGFAPVRATKDLIASGMEAAVDRISKSGIDRTKSILNPLKEADRALYTAGMEDYTAAEEMLSSVNLKSGDSISRIEQYKPAFGGDKAIWRALSKVAEANSNALAFEDMLFKKTTYASAFAGYLKSNGITEKMLKNGEATESFLDNARAYAFQEALKATYNDVNSFSNFVASFGNLRYSSNSVEKAAGFLVEGVLPFKRTPANIVTRAVEYSPIGMVNGIKKSLVDVRSGKVTAAEAIDALASGLTGTVLLGLGGLLANMGLVSGGDDDDDKQKDFDKLRGKQSYALNAFGGSYTIDWLAPEIIPLFIGVELYNRVQEDGGIGFNDLLESFARVSNPLLEMSCLQSLNDLLDNVSYSDNKLYSIFSQAAANHVLQALPTLFGQIERVGETERETTYIDKDSQIPKDLQYTIAKAANKIPGVEYEQIPFIDAYGRRQETGNLATRMFANLLSPGYLSSDRSAPWDDELQRLYSMGYTSVLPSQAAKKIGDYDLNAEEYVEYATFTGEERYRLLSEVTKSKYFIESSDADKAEILADVYGYVNACGSKKILPDREVAKWTEKAAAMEKIGIPFSDFVRMKNEALNENGNATKDGYVSYIRDNFPLDKQKDVWEIMKSPNWKNSGTPW